MNMQALTLICSYNWLFFLFFFPPHYSLLLATTRYGNLLFNGLAQWYTQDINFIKKACQVVYFVKVYNMELSYCILLPVPFQCSAAFVLGKNMILKFYFQLLFKISEPCSCFVSFCFFTWLTLLQHLAMTFHYWFISYGIFRLSIKCR